MVWTSTDASCPLSSSPRASVAELSKEEFSVFWGFFYITQRSGKQRPRSVNILLWGMFAQANEVDL